MRKQFQFYSPKDWEKERKEGRSELLKLLLTALLWAVFWTLVFGGSLALIGWIAANGEQIDHVCNNFWK